MKKIVFAALAIAVLAGLGWWYTKQPAEVEPYSFELVSGDVVTSWDYQGAYTGNVELVTRATNEIARLKKLFGTDETSDYELYVSIANQYDLLGDGANNFLYLKKALAVDATATGLAWYNTAVLTARLGAFETSGFAYESAARAQAIPQYQNALSEFIQKHPEVIKGVR